MSNSLAIAAVTAALRNILVREVLADPELADTTVSTRPLDRARDERVTANQLNLFLYHTALSTTVRTKEVSRAVKRGEMTAQPLALDLYYLLTAYSRDDDEITSHRVLGRGMSVLHSYAALGAAELKAALPHNDLHRQVERVRILLEPLSLADMTTLWEVAQARYRLSVAYLVSVVLLDSVHAGKAATAALRRDPDAQDLPIPLDAVPTFPTLFTVHPPNQQPRARLGDVLTLSGKHLDGDSVIIRFMSPRLPAAIELDPLADGSATTVMVALPEVAAEWSIGIYAVSATISRVDDVDRATNILPLVLAPRILTVTPNPASRDPNGQVLLTVTCSPEVRPEQRASLLVGAREVLAQPHPFQTGTLTFVIAQASLGAHPIRLRVEGIESLPEERTEASRKAGPTQTVTII